MGINFGNVTGGELNLRHRGNVIWNGNELMRMGGNGNVASHFRTVTMWWWRVVRYKNIIPLGQLISFLKTIRQ